MDQQCSEIKAEAHEAGDRHYRAMTKWLVNGRSRELLKKAYPLALQYRRALGWLIDCYKHARYTITGEGKMAAAAEFQDLVQRDIDILDKFKPEPLGDPTK